jgi:hypothetical protein
VPRPSLLAAIVAKGAACGLPGNTDRHFRDLALLLCLVEDPFDVDVGQGSKSAPVRRHSRRIYSPGLGTRGCCHKATREIDVLDPRGRHLISNEATLFAGIMSYAAGPQGRIVRHIPAVSES